MRRFSSTILPLLLLAGCLGTLPPAEHRQRAEALLASKDFAGAAREIAFSLRRDPGQVDLHLLRGDLLERLDRPEEALAAFADGSRNAPPEDPRRGELLFRRALLLVRPLTRPAEARPLIQELPENDPRRTLIEATLSLQEGRPLDTLAQLNRALAVPLEKDLSARILYTAALAYHRLGEVDRTSQSLFHAINLAEGLALIRQIELLWEELNAATPSSH